MRRDSAETGGSGSAAMALGPGRRPPERRPGWGWDRLTLYHKPCRRPIHSVGIRTPGIRNHTTPPGGPAVPGRPTRTLPIDPVRGDADVLRAAAAVVRAGGLVAFPTETVYGLGANALDPVAVAGIFAAKGRPPANPLIVHIEGDAMLREVAAAWPATAAALAARFWPGPLTLVLPKTEAVPDVVTGGGPTVAVRVPAHPVALGLIRAAGGPLAAPSANRSSELSPTRAEHVRAGLD